MNKFIKYISVLGLISLIHMAYSDNHVPRSYGMEGYQCNLQPGKDLNDVMKL